MTQIGHLLISCLQILLAYTRERAPATKEVLYVIRDLVPFVQFEKREKDP